MKINFRHICKVAWLPLAVLLLLPLTDVLYWKDAEMPPVPVYIFRYWTWGIPDLLVDSFPLFEVPFLIWLLMLVRWFRRPCLHAGIWLAIGSYIFIGPPMCIFFWCGGFFFR